MMNTTYFVSPHSIVRRIWGKSDTILLIFAGAAAEFALNKAVDWLYFTGKLPADPLARLFSTVAYARAILFSEEHTALKAIDSMTHIHARVEENRGARIPDWAYRDVLFMLIDYSIRSHELLERSLTQAEKNEVLHVFNRMGHRMGLQGLPQTFPEWEEMRAHHLEHDLHCSHYSLDLFKQYAKHLGRVRYWILREAQSLVVPTVVNNALVMRKRSLFQPFIALYKWCREVKMDWVLKDIILPEKYKQQIRALDSVPGMS